MGRVWLWVLLLVLVLAGVQLLVGSSGSRGDRDRSPPEDASGPTAGASDGIDERSSEAPRRANELHSVEEPPAGGLAVRVVRGDRALPAAGALVSFVEDAAADERFFRAGGDGVVLVPRPGGVATLVCKTEDLGGTLLVRASGPHERTLRLRPDPPLQVRVVGTDGEPRGRVPVALRRLVNGATRNLVVAETDPVGGLARLLHPRTSLDADPGGVARVGLALPLREPVEVRTGDLVSPDPIELVIPETGSLEVLLHDAEGLPFLGRASVSVTASRDADEGSAPPTAKGTGSELLTRQGHALFHHVGLRLSLEIRVRPEATYRPLVRHYVGPTNPGERITIPLVVSELATAVLGRVVGPDGAPWDGTRAEGAGEMEWLLAVSSGRGAVRARGALETDEAGSFELVLPDGWPGGGGFLELSTVEAESRHRLSARVALPDVLPAGPHDLGAMRLSLPPVLASGRVIDDQGRPVARAEIRVDALLGPGSSRWLDRPELVSWCDEDGAFVIRGTVPGSRVGLTARHPEHAMGERLECDVGTSDVLLELESSGEVEGRLLLDPDVPASFFSATAYLGGPEGRIHAGELAADGGFRIRGLSSGEYRVFVGLKDEEGTAEVFDGVVVRPGATNRIGSVDLRGRVSVIVLEVEDAEGTAPARGIVRRRAPEARSFEGRIEHLHAGRIELATLHSHLDLSVAAPGHRTRVLEDVVGDTRVVLEAAPRVRLVLEDGLPYLDANERLGVVLERRGGVRSWGSGILPFDERGMAEPFVEEPGLYDVRVLFWRDEGDGATRVSRRIEATIDVLDDGAAQTFGFRLSPDTMARIDAR